MPRGIRWRDDRQAWQVACRIDGKRKRLIVHGTIEDAVTYRKRVEAEGLVPTLADYAPQYLTRYASQKSATFKAERLERLTERLGHLRLCEITPAVVERYREERAAVDKVAVSTINRDVAVLGHLLGRAAALGDCPASVAAELRAKCPLQKENNRRLRYLTTDEIKRLLAKCAKHLRPVVVVALQTGMRRGELLNLQRQDVDLHGRRVTLRDAKAGARYVRLNDEAVAAIRGIVPRLDCPYVFQWRGRRIANVKTAFAYACREAKLEGVCFHTLRHTFASHLAMAGANTETIREALGHTTTRMTERYTHLRSDYVDEFLGRLYRVG